MLKTTVGVMAPLIVRLANMSFSAGVFHSIIIEARPDHATVEEARTRPVKDP